MTLIFHSIFATHFYLSYLKPVTEQKWTIIGGRMHLHSNSIHIHIFIVLKFTPLSPFLSHTQLSWNMSPYINTMGEVGNPLPPLVGPPPAAVAEGPGHSTHRSIETLVVVLAVITLIGVIAGIIARLCGGRGNGDGCVESRCRSCIEAGVDTAPPPPAKEEEPKPAAAAKKWDCFLFLTLKMLLSGRIWYFAYFYFKSYAQLAISVTVKEIWKLVKINYSSSGTLVGIL